MTYDSKNTPETRRALLVDDDAALRGLLSVLLSQMGFSATCARNGTDALDILNREDRDAFEVVVTDIRMPKMSGIELARKIRSRRPGVPILFISGYAPSMAEVEKELDERADFLKKPFEFATFSQTLENLLDRAASREKPGDDAGSPPSHPGQQAAG